MNEGCLTSIAMIHLSSLEECAHCQSHKFLFLFFLFLQQQVLLLLQHRNISLHTRTAEVSAGILV